MDAISFVLGIKSSHLRSTHLRDLIYRGRILKTSKIQADGTAAEEHGHEDRVNGVDGEGEEVDMSSQRNDATTAWVMAVYEDDMGEEQHWKRTVTSSGHSEYQVNNRRVSANEYNEILEAENILVKARNFLVFQGDVENVASQSPKDLTRLVEQISGSLEYKSDYDRLQIESEKAAEDQQFKLNQRRGINAEIKQYQEQKKEAENFNRKAEDRDNAVVTHVLWKLYQFQRVIEESGAEIQRHQDELKEHKRNVETYEKRLEESKKDQFKAGKEVAKSERTIKSTEKDIDEKMHDLVPIDEKIDLSSKNLERYRKRIDEITKEKKSQSKSVDDIKQNLGKVTKAQSKWEADSKKAAESEGRQLSDKDLQEYNKIRAEVNKKAATSQIKVDNLVRQRKTDEETVNNLRSSVEESERMIQKLQSENVEIQERHENHSSQAKQYSSDIDKKKREFNQMTSKRLQAAQRRTELDERLQQVLQKLIEADDGRRQSEKEIRARETVASMKRIFPGVKGRLHELCKPKQKKFETAVSTVLGRNFDSIIVDTEKTAKDCITWLRDQQAGQATFIPLETIQVKAVSSNLKGMHKKMTLAIDTINYDHALEPAMSYACGNAMVCDDLETAKFLCYQKNIEARAVTLEGTVIHKGGLMTGGRGPNDNSNRKWADSEVENLRKQKDKLMADLASLPQGHKAITDEESLQAELSGLEQRLAYAQQEMKALEKNQQSKKKELAFVQKQLKESKPKYEESSRNLSTLEQRIKEFQQEVSTVEDGLFGAFCKRLGYDNIRAYEAQQGALQQEAAQKKLEFSTQRSKLENQLTFESGRLQSTKDRIKSLEEQSKRDEDLISSLQEEKQAMEEELVEIRNALEETKAQLQQQKEVHDEKSEKVSDARKQVQKRNKDAQFLHDSLTKLESDINRTASQRYALLRKCKMEQVKLPLTDSSTALDSLPIDDAAGAQRDPEAMDVDDEEENLNAAEVIKDYGIEVSFEVLDDDLKDVSINPIIASKHPFVALRNAQTKYSHVNHAGPLGRPRKNPKNTGRNLSRRAHNPKPKHARHRATQCRREPPQNHR